MKCTKVPSSVQHVRREESGCMGRQYYRRQNGGQGRNAMKYQMKRVLCAAAAVCLSFLCLCAKAEKTDVRKLQERLLSLGYEIGEADGIAGEKTKSAILLAQTLLADTEDHTEGILGVVLKYGVGKCRASAVRLGRVWIARNRKAPGLGTAGRIGDDHTLAEKLCQEFHVSGFAAACTGT